MGLILPLSSSTKLCAVPESKAVQHQGMGPCARSSLHTTQLGTACALETGAFQGSQEEASEKDILTGLTPLFQGRSITEVDDGAHENRLEDSVMGR